MKLGIWSIVSGDRWDAMKRPGVPPCLPANREASRQGRKIQTEDGEDLILLIWFLPFRAILLLSP